jgi:fructose-bisphosphate aldolase class I
LCTGRSVTFPAAAKVRLTSSNFTAQRGLTARRRGNIVTGHAQDWLKFLFPFNDIHSKDRTVSIFDQQLQKIEHDKGFIAALDQSGGSTPKALKLYGVNEDAWTSEEGMYDVVHQMRTRIMASPAFTGKRLIGAILFENTMDRDVAGKPTPTYLWEVKGVVPFLKIDKGLADEKDGVQLMKPIGGLDALLQKAKSKNVFGTKMRSVIKAANAAAIDAVVKQQFEVGKQIIAAGLVPIIEPEVDIKTPNKNGAEELLKAAILKELNALKPEQRVMLKLTIPDTDNLYTDLIKHKNVIRVVALSGGYPREESNRRLARNNGMTASFSRALSEGLTAQQSDAEFNAALDASVESIYQASIT